MLKDRSIYICDDHRLFLESIEIYFGLKDGFYCIGHAEDSKKAIADILQIKPDIILIDYHLKNENGLDLLQKIKSLGIQSHCFMLTMRRDALIRNKARELGARGYILKTIGGEKMLTAFQECLLDDNFFFDSLSENNVKDDIPEQVNLLTNRELEIAKLVCLELSSEQIADKLFLSLHTVNTHRKNILKKINAKNAIDIMNYLKELEIDNNKLTFQTHSKT
jgi:DNA-binding NarL/FixJ family response regulator